MLYTDVVSDFVFFVETSAGSLTKEIQPAQCTTNEQISQFVTLLQETEVSVVPGNIHMKDN